MIAALAVLGSTKNLAVVIKNQALSFDG